MIKVLGILVLFINVCQADIDKLIPVLIQVESSGNDKAISDNGKAYGCLQIWDVVVKDVNRVYKTNYKHEHMFYRNNACEVCFLYLTFWGKRYEINTGKVATMEVLSKIWNGGPSGYKKKATEKYWTKVKRLLK
jgi:hypothetical protein